MFAGLLADKLIKSGWSITKVRKSLQTVAFLGPALALILLSRSKDPRLAVACMTCALGITSLGEMTHQHSLWMKVMSLSVVTSACMVCALNITSLGKMNHQSLQ